MRSRVVATAVWLAEFAPECGGNMIRLKHRSSGVEVLRSPPSRAALTERPELYGVPVLMPPNRIDGGSFKWNGCLCRLPLNEPARNNHIHGVALGRPWTVDWRTHDRIRMSFLHGTGSGTFPGFPFKFRMSVEYRFADSGVTQFAEAENLGAEEMPFGLGWHTAFALPASDARLMISAGGSRWEIEDVRKLPTGQLLPWSAGSTMHLPEGQLVEDGPISAQCPAADAFMDGRPFHGAVIESESRRVRIVYESSAEYGQWCVWNDGGGKGFVCVEPMTCMTDALNVELPRELSGLRSIQAGGRFSATTSIRVLDGHWN